jgi:ferric-dicitrate binding protein FerR (iron transport regulator)
MEDHWTWISAYLDSELTEAQQQHLERWIDEDPAHQELFAFQSIVVHSQLLDWFNEGRIQESLLKRVRQLVAHTDDGNAGEDWTSEDLSALLLDAGIPLKEQAHPTSKTSPIYRRLPSLAAAVVACCVTLAVLAYFWTRPQVVAHVARCVSCRWAPNQPQIVGGAILHEGQEIELLEGKSQIVFRSGAILNVQGPARLLLDDPLACELSAGRVSAFVPAEATGFTVASGPVKVVDRGTEFTVIAAESESVKLYVHSGLVDVEVAPPSLEETTPLLMVEKRAMSVNCRSGEVSFSLPYKDSVWVSIPDKL